MEESIKKIIHSKTLMSVILIIIIFILSTSIFFTDSTKKNKEKGIGIDSRKININIVDDKILCEDVIAFNRIKHNEISYKFIKEKKYLSNVNVEYINDKDNFYSTTLKMSLASGEINLDDFLLNSLKITGRNITIKLTYELEKDYITRYKDKDVLTYFIDWENLSYLNNLTLNINSNGAISNLNVDDTINNATISSNKNKYVINVRNLQENSNVNILFNINDEINNTINSEYINEKTVKENEERLKEKAEYSYINDRIPLLIGIVIISLLIFLIAFIINKKEKINTYRRETLGLVPPIIAESIIDGKIGLKELIMTTIIDLNVRGNIKIINNDILELVSLDNLEEYERDIIELLFKNNIIRISDINNIFAKSNKETLLFTGKINKIKNVLSDKIFELDIFSRPLTIVNKIIQLSTILISLNLPLIFLKNSSKFEEFFIFIDILTIIYYIKKNKNKTTTQEELIRRPVEEHTRTNQNFIILCIIILFVTIISTINIAKYHLVFLVITILTFILNLYTSHKSNVMALTSKGKKERAKLIELKNYINDYSLIKNRDLESVIIWDEYLSYATAFGIPNKVTESIYEGWYNLNLNLQVLEKIFR